MSTGGRAPGSKIPGPEPRHLPEGGLDLLALELERRRPGKLLARPDDEIRNALVVGQPATGGFVVSNTPGHRDPFTRPRHDIHRLNLRHKSRIDVRGECNAGRAVSKKSFDLKYSNTRST